MNVNYLMNTQNLIDILQKNHSWFVHIEHRLTGSHGASFDEAIMKFLRFGSVLPFSGVGSPSKDDPDIFVNSIIILKSNVVNPQAQFSP